MSPHLTVQALLEEGARRLQAGGEAASAAATPALDAQLLLAHALNVPTARLRSHPEARPSALERRSYRALLARRARGMPVAYLRGQKQFWSLTLAVTKAVLIPRPETELLVERALALRSAQEGSVADLGTGSGAIALAPAGERPPWRVVATDVSAPALALARKNARALGLHSRVQFRRGDWFKPLAGQRFDLLVSNPPYVAAADPAMMTPALAHEPRRALTPGADALACLRLLARGAPAHLQRGGWLLLEHGAEQGAAVREALVLAGFRHVRSHRDLAGQERMTEAQHGHL